MISVCMCTYNGEKYIKKQMESIRTQSVSPDEVIIVDDISSDSTVSIIKQYIEDNNLSAIWKLYINYEKKGYPRNFYYCMSLAHGDYVFLADQDDIWKAKKIEIMKSFLEQNEKIKVLCCAHELIDSNDRKIHSIMSPHIYHGKNRLKSITLASVLKYNAYPGMAIGYKCDWVNKELIIYKEKQISKIPHDLLLCVKATECGGLYHVKDTLCYHRRHENNVGREEHKIGQNLNKRKKMEDIEMYIGYINEMIAIDLFKNEWEISLINEWKSILENRLGGLRSGRVSDVIKYGLKNRKRIRLKSFIGDLGMVIR